ncbi:hypothetical protein D3C86_1949080 [compost metagenome]
MTGGACAAGAASIADSVSPPPIRIDTISLAKGTGNNCMMLESIRSPMASRNDILINTSSSGSFPSPFDKFNMSIPGGEILTNRLKIVDMDVADEPII